MDGNKLAEDWLLLNGVSFGRGGKEIGVVGGTFLALDLHCLTILPKPQNKTWPLVHSEGKNQRKGWQQREPFTHFPLSPLLIILDEDYSLLRLFPLDSYTRQTLSAACLLPRL